MLCQEHEHAGFTMAGGPCSLCGNQTNSQYKLCERCGTALDQCEVCCAALNTGRNPLLIRAFQSDEVVAALKACREAKANELPTFEAANTIFQAESAPALARLKAAIAPHQDKLIALEKPFTDEYLAVCQETDAVRNNPEATAGQQLDAKNRWSAAMNSYSKTCRPFRTQFDADIKPLNDQYNLEVAQFEAKRKEACQKALNITAAANAHAEATIQDIFKRATSTGARFTNWVWSLLGH